MPVCLCVCACVVCVCVCVCVCVRTRAMEMMKKMLNDVLYYSVLVYIISNVPFSPVYILSTILFLYCALWAHVRCKRLVNPLLRDMTLHIYSSVLSRQQRTP